jgi:SAM-dependent methyltransferase
MKQLIKNTLKRGSGVHALERKVADIESALVAAESSGNGQGENLGQLKAEVAQLKHEIMMPKYQYSVPMDYSTESWPPDYDPPIHMSGVELPIPPADVRPGYSPEDDQEYIEWGKDDHDFILGLIKKHRGLHRDMTILDWGCSSGRVLRHFRAEHQSLGWRLHGTDIQTYLVEWLRQNFPPEFAVISGSTFPHLPYKDESLDVIYGISVFTHTKYLWDFWLTEFQRVLKPGGLCIQTFQCEEAWRFYHKNRHVDWVRAAHPQCMLSQTELDQDYFLFGDVNVSQIFFKEEVLKRYWGRIMELVDFQPPQKRGFQNWVVLRAPG